MTVDEEIRHDERAQLGAGFDGGGVVPPNDEHQEPPILEKEQHAGFELEATSAKEDTPTLSKEESRSHSLPPHEDEEQSGADLPDLQTMTTSASSRVPYTIFTVNQRRFIVFMAAWAGFFSAISANIYFPALTTLANSFHVSSTLINLTLTSYMIFQALAPTMVGDFADMAGRRPAYIVCFIIYIGANIGLALCQNYASLFILRCMQSSGSSATISLGTGVVADVATSSERGLWMGWVLAGPMIA